MATGNITKLVYDIPVATLNNIIEFATTEVRTMRLLIQASSGNEHQTSELFIIHDNTYVYVREIDPIYTQDPFITYTSQLADNTVRILANSSLVNTDIVIWGVTLEVINKSAANSTISQDKILEAAASMKGLYPDDTTDYVKLQAGSLFKEHLIAELDREIKDGMEILSSPSFDALSDVEKNTMIESVANTITTRNAALQESIDADLSAIAEVDTKIETAGTISGITESYKDPQAKALLDLTLNSSIKAMLQ